MASGSRIEAADLEEFRQNIFGMDKQNFVQAVASKDEDRFKTELGKDSCNFGIDKGIDKTVPIQTLSSLLGQNIYTDLAYPFINEWQWGWTDVTQQLGAEPVPIQTWSSQLGQQIYTDLATPFINEWQVDERAFGCGGAAMEYSFIEVDWESFVFTVQTQTPRPKSSLDQNSTDTFPLGMAGKGMIDGQDTCSETSENSDKSVAPDGRFRYRSEADEAELRVDWGQSCSSGDSEDTDTDSDTDKSRKDTDTDNYAPCRINCQKSTIEERRSGSSEARLFPFLTVPELRACRTACCRSFMAATTAIIKEIQAQAQSTPGHGHAYSSKEQRLLQSEQRLRGTRMQLAASRKLPSFVRQIVACHEEAVNRYDKPG